MRLDSRSALWSAVVLAAIIFVVGTAARSVSASKKDAGKPGAAMASVNGQPVDRAAFEAAIGKASFEVQQQYYDLQRQILDQMILDDLVAKEAKTRGVTPEALRKAEVDDKVKPVTAEELDVFYEMNKGQMGGRSKEEMKPRIEGYLASQRQGEAKQKFEDELRKKANVQVHLDPPRREVEIPADAPALGPANAPITMVEFTDYECPFCQRAQATVDEVMKEHGDKIRLVVRDYPLEFHSRALYASRASHCAGEQKAFWEYHHDLLRKPGNYSDEDLVRRATELKLDAAAFKACIASDKFDAQIRASQEAGSKMGVSGTPAFFLNGRMINGARPKSDFDAIIADEMTRRTAVSSR
jgi:protein-disulfide isomerase